MGKRGFAAKQASRRREQHANTLAVITGAIDKRKPPPAPKGLSAATRRAWRAYWASEVASVTCEADLPAIRRLFRHYDELAQALELVEQSGIVVKGSMGQIRVNPLRTEARAIEVEIGRLETELGLTPMARARLGLEIARAAMTVEEINAMARRRKLAGTDETEAIDDELEGEWAPAE